MKIYMTSALDSDSTDRRMRNWDTSADDASKSRTALKRMDKACEPETIPVDVPTTRKELAAFLNRLCYELPSASRDS
jgi:hypothetical protein